MPIHTFTPFPPDTLREISEGIPRWLFTFFIEQRKDTLLSILGEADWLNREYNWFLGTLVSELINSTEWQQRELQSDRTVILAAITPIEQDGLKKKWWDIPAILGIKEIKIYTLVVKQGEKEDTRIEVAVFINTEGDVCWYCKKGMLNGSHSVHNNVLLDYDDQTTIRNFLGR